MVPSRKLARVLQCIVAALMLADLAAIFATPFWLNVAYKKGYASLLIFFGSVYDTAHPGGSYYFMAAFIIVCGIFIMGILFEALRILDRIIRSVPFSPKNAKSFRNAGICAFLLTAMFTGKMFFSPSLLTVVCAGVFVLFALFMVVLSQLFKIAAQIKEENELTI